MKTKISFEKTFTKLTLLLTVLFFFSASYGQKYTYDDSWGKQGMKITEQSNSGVSINYSITKFYAEDMDVKGETMKNIGLPGHFLPNDEGAPNLPGSGRYIAIPQGATAKLNIVEMRTERISNIDILPAPRIPLDTDTSPLKYEKNEKIYSTNAFYPAEPVKLSEPSKLRGVDVVMLGITPFQYNPVTKELRVIRDIKIEIEFIGGNNHFGEDRLRSRWFDPVVLDAILNYEQLPKIDYSKRSLKNREEGCEYLIVSPNGQAYQDWADSIRMFRIKQGILTKVVTLSEIGGNDVNTLENYFNNAYNNWDIPPAAVLLLGDYGNDASKNVIAPIWDNYCASDNIYADVDNDDLPDMTFARITANNETQLETMVTKFINHERTPPENFDFYNNPVTAMGWQTSRWFQICSESVNGFFENVLGKEPVRENAIYSGSPGSTWSTATNTQMVVDYFGPDGVGYIPATPAHLNDWGGNATRLNSDINSGAFIIQHRDHGFEQGWGEPDYDNNDIDGCTNSDLTFVFSINCLTGKYNWSGECFTEKFHRYTYNGDNSGALGLLGASEVSYSFVNDTYVWGAYNNMWTNFLPDYGTNPESRDQKPAFANSAGKYYLQQSNWPYNTNNKTVTYHLFHHHGGAFLSLYSEMPQDLDVYHQDVIIAGVDYFTVTANEGSLIALTIGDEILATAEGTGSPLDIPIEPQDPGTIVDLVITKQNYYRYERGIEVIPPEGAFCIYHSHTFNDESGNDNGYVDYGEDILLTLTLENLGNDAGIDIDASINTGSLYLNVTDDSETYDSVPANGTSAEPDGFAFTVADDVEDQTEVRMDVSATNGDDTWESVFSFTINAPVLSVKNLIVDDSEFGNDNGRMDPGETVTLKIRNYNTGHCSAYKSDGDIEVHCPYILVDNDHYNIGEIPILTDKWAEFTMTIDSAAPNGSVANITYTVSAGSYEVEKTFSEEIGSLVEDWETGDFTKFDWQFAGDADWSITSSSYEGAYAAKSGNIGNSEQSILKISTNVSSFDSISFYFKTSSELGRDKLKFYIDNTEMGAWSGQMTEYQYASFPVHGGFHTFKWIYEKDDFLGLGDDCAYVDFITFPPMPVLSAFAGHDNYSCENSDFQCQGVATNYTSLEWVTSGTGTFDDNTIQQPLYTPSQEDYENGQVVLQFTALDSYGNSDVDDMVLTFTIEPQTPYMPDGPTLIDLAHTTTSTYETNKIPFTEYYEWNIEPEDAGMTESTSEIAEVEWNEDYLGMAYIKVRAVNDCGNSQWSEVLEVTLDYAVDIPEEEIQTVSIYPNPTTGNVNLDFPSNDNEEVIINIFNSTGTLIYQKSVKAEGTQIHHELNMDNLSKGIYFVKIEGTETNHFSKIILN